MSSPDVGLSAALSNLARPLEIARRREYERVAVGERASQNDVGVLELLPCVGQVVAGESRRSKCREGLPREEVLLAKDLRRIASASPRP